MLNWSMFNFLILLF